jgi:hypothetical protein
MLRSVIRVGAPGGGLSGAGRARVVRGLVFLVVLAVMPTSLFIVFMRPTLAAKYDGLMTPARRVATALTLGCTPAGLKRYQALLSNGISVRRKRNRTAGRSADFIHNR